MIEFKNHLDMISCWADAGRPLCQDTIDDIEYSAAESRRLGLGTGWLVFEGKCRICNYVQNIICPVENDIDNQECGNCGHMTMQEKEIPEWEEDNDQCYPEQ